MLEILPSILAENAEELREKLMFPGLWEPGMTAHVDILDGSMFGARCFCDAAAVTALHESPLSASAPSLLPHKWGRDHVPFIELHCMIQNPLPIIEQWKALVPETIRAIVHAEISRPLSPILDAIRACDLETGVALCPETAPDVIDVLSQLPDRILVMGVQPGHSGHAFLGEPILAKIRRIRAIHPSLAIAVDGGVTQENMQNIINAGANALIAGSAIWGTDHPRNAYLALTHSAALPPKNNL